MAENMPETILESRSDEWEPPTNQEDAVESIAISEAHILHCLEKIFCKITGRIERELNASVISVEDAVKLTSCIFCAAAAKEKAIAAVLDGIAAKEDCCCCGDC